MDSIEEIPIADISATYLTDEQFNNLYPKHPIDVSKYILIVTFNLKLFYYCNHCNFKQIFVSTGTNGN